MSEALPRRGMAILKSVHAHRLGNRYGAAVSGMRVCVFVCTKKDRCARIIFCDKRTKPAGLRRRPAHELKRERRARFPRASVSRALRVSALGLAADPPPRLALSVQRAGRSDGFVLPLP